MFVYKTTNLLNGKMYIGMCSRDDPNYLGSGKLLKHAIKKYGKNNFKREIIEECSSFDELLEREIFWIEYYDAANSSNYYNIACGGKSGNSDLLKEYWGSMIKEQRQNSRNWKPHFLLNPTTGENHPSKTNERWVEKVSKGVKHTWNNYTEEEKETRLLKSQASGFGTYDKSGSNNPMFGRSAVTEKNLRWYQDGKTRIYVTEGTQPDGFIRGKKIKPI